MSRWDKLAKLFGIAAEDVAKLSPETINTLEKISTPEISTALKGSEKQKYLKALDEAYGPRDTRASNMGFGNKTWYHGTTVPIDEFQKDALGLSTGAESAKKGFFFAQDPSTASDYAELAREKGLIREGDKITTRSLSETADLQNDLYDQIRSLSFDRDIKLGNIQRQLDRNINTQAILDNAIKNNQTERIDDLKNKLKQGEEFINKMRQESEALTKQIKNIDDSVGSQGQNVLPVRLKGNADTIHVKDYKGQGYRDTTYADEMKAAQDAGKDAVLFKNTYDPADPNNRVKQNIAAVFNPEQIRSTNAAFDPRFKDSAKILAGVGTLPASQQMNLENTVNNFSEDIVQPIVSRYEKLKSMITNPLAQQLDLTKDKSETENLKQALDIGLDPTNLVGGVPGAAIGGLQLLGSKGKK